MTTATPTAISASGQKYLPSAGSERLRSKIVPTAISVPPTMSLVVSAPSGLAVPRSSPGRSTGIRTHATR